MLLRNRIGKSDCVKTFDSYSSETMAVTYTLKQSNVSMSNVSVECLILM